jgi:hypothetical protein
MLSGDLSLHLQVLRYAQRRERRRSELGKATTSDGAALPFGGVVPSYVYLASCVLAADLPWSQNYA